MKINFLGDSITAGATLASVDEMYTNILCKKVGAIENNYGVCGTRIARQTKPSTEAKFDEDFLKRAEKLDTTADFTFVFGGTNDYGHGDASLGEIGDKTPYSFYGALNLLTEYLLTKFNNRKFCYVLPLPRYNENSPYGENGCKKSGYPLSAYRQAIKEVAEKHDVGVVDLSDAFPPPTKNTGDEFTADGLHPNKNGHKIIAERLYFYLNSKGVIMNEKISETKSERLIPDYDGLHRWEFYPADAEIEYMQCFDEGLDVAPYKRLFAEVQAMPRSEAQKIFGDALFTLIRSLKKREGYKYDEPSDYESIKSLRKPYPLTNVKPISEGDYDKVYGAWTGRVCGCMHGKPIEGIRTNILIPFLKETDNYPLKRYIYKKDFTDKTYEKYSGFLFKERVYADEIDCMPWDDDTNYVVLDQIIIEKYGKNFTAANVAEAWLDYQKKNAYCTAERVAFVNFVNGYKPPYSATYKNPYREWIGAQIRGDYYGYIFPGDPERAAEAAFKDASISHVKNGIYGEMFVAAALAVAACTDNMIEIIKGGLAYVPATSRFYEEVYSVVNMYEQGLAADEVFAYIHEKYDEYTGYGWCHTNSNAMIVAASLLFGNGDYGKSICLAVETGFDTDCNGATVGSIFGMAHGIKSIPEYWTKPINDKLETTVFGVGTVKISEKAKLTLEHIAK